MQEQETFAVGDVIYWKVQALDEDDVEFLIEQLTMGMIGPFVVGKVKTVNKSEIKDYGHHQVLNIVELDHPKEVIEEVTGYFFYKGAKDELDADERKKLERITKKIRKQNLKLVN